MEHQARRLLFATLALMSCALATRTAVSQSPDNRLADRLDRLEAGLHAEEGIRAVKRLHHSYSHYLDMGLWADLADLFSDNAVVEMPDGTATGKNQIRTHFMKEAKAVSPGLGDGRLNSHLALQPIITLGPDGKTAKGTWHELGMLGQFGTSALWRGGIYENEYVLDKGVWKISKMHLYPEYDGAYEDFGHKAPPKWNIPYHFDSKHVGVTIPASAWAPATPSSKTPAGTRLAQLTQRAQQLNDETAVANLQHSYGFYLDRKLWDDVADLFADGGSFEVDQRGIYVGRPRIRKAIEVFYGASPLKTGELFDHLNLGTVVTVDGNSARARTMQLSMLGVNFEYGRWELGVYENEFVKQNGVWKIKALHYYPRMITDYEKGWGKDAKPAPTASKEFPPDRGPSRPHETYPTMSPVAVHFVHPVTGRAAKLPSVAAVATARLEAALSEAERKLDAAIAVDAAENLMSSYGYYLDESAWDNMADTFAVANGAKEISGAGVYVGQEKIRKILNLRGPRGGRGATSFTIHQLTQPVIHVSDDGQTVKVRLRLFQCGGAASGASGSWIGGLYENTAVKENGEWKFGIQDLHHTFNAPYRTGWAKMNAPSRVGSAVAGPRLVTEMAPDRPIRSRQYAFPEIDEPAFHYRNPVSGRMPAQLLP